MPIHLIWGDDATASERAIELLISELIDPSWSSINLSRLDGSDPDQASQALEEARTPPFGGGCRLVLLQRSPFCNACPSELADRFAACIELIADNSHLVLSHPNKPDARLRTTKLLQTLIKQGVASEQKHLLPAVWDGAGQRQLVERTAAALNLELDADAISALVEAIGNDSARLSSELSKLAIHADSSATDASGGGAHKHRITAEAVGVLVEGMATNALQVGDALLAGDAGDAIARFDALIEAGEPALRIVATLTGQIRGWLWVSLLEQQGERDVAVIAKAAGIGNPKRIYVMRKQLQGKPAKRFLSLLSRLLEVEASLKRGVLPRDAFRDGLLGQI
ncbi:MAG: DNA polymerase III subunit delta [Prochlorococcus sp.]